MENRHTTNQHSQGTFCFFATKRSLWHNERRSGQKRPLKVAQWKEILHIRKSNAVPNVEFLTKCTFKKMVPCLVPWILMSLIFTVQQANGKRPLLGLGAVFILKGWPLGPHMQSICETIAEFFIPMSISFMINHFLPGGFHVSHGHNFLFFTIHLSF